MLGLIRVTFQFLPNINIEDKFRLTKSILIFDFSEKLLQPHDSPGVKQVFSEIRRRFEKNGLGVFAPRLSWCRGRKNLKEILASAREVGSGFHYHQLFVL